MVFRHTVDVGRFAKLRLWRGSCGTYARLLMPELLSNVAWCLYVDGDTLFTDDVTAMLRLYDSSYAIQGYCEGDDDPALKLYFQERNIPWHCDQYVCAAFLLMNLVCWRENSITQNA